MKEKDLTNIIPAVSNSIGGTAGLFEWGPASEVTSVSSEADLIDKFGYPKVSGIAGSNNRLDWYNAANFLGYSSSLQVVRVLTDGARNAVSEPVAVGTEQISIIVSGSPNASATVAVPYDGTNSVNVSIDSTDTPHEIARHISQAMIVSLIVADPTIINSLSASEFTVSYDKGSRTLPTTFTDTDRDWET